MDKQMTDLTHYQKYKQTITAYNHKKVTCDPDWETNPQTNRKMESTN